jgi:hypothetical protein
MKLRVSLALVLLAAFAAYAQSDKDLIGSWKMDASRSSFAGRGAPSNVLISFASEDGLLRETIKVQDAAGETTRTINYSLNGAETVNGSGDERVKAKILHQGDRIVLEWNDDGGTYTRTLKLSNDARTLSIRARDTNPDAKTDDLIVLQRQ